MNFNNMGLYRVYSVDDTTHFNARRFSLIRLNFPVIGSDPDVYWVLYCLERRLSIFIRQQQSKTRRLIQPKALEIMPDRVQKGSPLFLVVTEVRSNSESEIERTRRTGAILLMLLEKMRKLYLILTIHCYELTPYQK